MEQRAMLATIWPIILVPLLLVRISDADEVTLFNAKDLDGWVAEGVEDFTKDGRTVPVWSVKDGHLVCTGKGFGFLRYDRRTFADFVLHVEFRMTPGCNSGIGIRTRPFEPARSRATRPSFYAYEIQLFDDAGKPPSVHSSGSLYRYVAPRKNAILPAGQWNSADIECVGSHIKVTLNSEVIVEVDQATVEALRQSRCVATFVFRTMAGQSSFERYV